MSAPVKHASIGLSLHALAAASPDEQHRMGYADTLREILQQPDTWDITAKLLERVEVRQMLSTIMASSPPHIILTGSGSSCFVGECLAPMLQAHLGIPCRAVASGMLLTDRSGVLPKVPGLLISIARSGDSPESTAVVDRILAHEPGYRHLVLTCNATGALTTRYTEEPRLQTLLLDARTNDRSLVMTSSFTNLLLSGAGLVATSGGLWPEAARTAATLGHMLFDRYADALAEQAKLNFDTAVYLGSGGALGAARESALKMLEMSGGVVTVLAETFLGLRHGPMSWLSRPGLVVAFLSSDPVARAYETDLLQELTRKRLGQARVVVGEDVPEELVGSRGLAVELPGLYQLPQVYAWMLQTVAGQLLAMFRCLHLGHQPDAPSQGVLTRVVGDFVIHEERRSP